MKFYEDVEVLERLKATTRLTVYGGRFIAAGDPRAHGAALVLLAE